MNEARRFGQAQRLLDASQAEAPRDSAAMANFRQAPYIRRRISNEIGALIRSCIAQTAILFEASTQQALHRLAVLGGGLLDHLGGQCGNGGGNGVG